MRCFSSVEKGIPPYTGSARVPMVSGICLRCNTVLFELRVKRVRLLYSMVIDSFSEKVVELTVTAWANEIDIIFRVHRKVMSFFKTPESSTDCFNLVKFYSTTSTFRRKEIFNVFSHLCFLPRT